MNHAQRVRSLPSENRRSRRSAYRFLAECVFKKHPAFCQFVQIGTDDVLVSIATEIYSEVIDRDEKDIGLGRHSHEEQSLDNEN